MNHSNHPGGDGPTMTAPVIPLRYALGINTYLTGGYIMPVDQDLLFDILTSASSDLFFDDGDICYRAAYVLYATITREPFIEENTRTAWAMSVKVLQTEGLRITETDDAIWSVLEFIELGNMNTSGIALWMRNNTEPIGESNF